MAKQLFPEEISTKIDRNAMYVTDANGDFLSAFSIQNLADSLFRGEKITAGDRANAGAFMKHFINKDALYQSTFSAMIDTVEYALSALIDEFDRNIDISVSYSLSYKDTMQRRIAEAKALIEKLKALK